MTEIESSVDSFTADGFAVVPDGCARELTERLLDTAMRGATEARAALGDQDIGIGAAAGYEEIVQRSPGRWDVPIDPQEFGLSEEDMPLRSLAAAVLGDDVEFWVSGVVSSEPGSTDQYWHSDSPHETAEHQPANVVTVLVALHDVPLEMGPTEFARGSHRLTNHLINPSLVVNELIYQHEGTTPESLVEGTSHPAPERFTCALSAGSCFVFDDRALHRGRANRSDATRHIGYFTYRRKGYNTDTYFETQGSLSDT